MYIIFYPDADRRHFYGPFKTAQAADTWARSSLDGGWVIQRLVEPMPPLRSRGRAAKSR